MASRKGFWVERSGFIYGNFERDLDFKKLPNECQFLLSSPSFKSDLIKTLRHLAEANWMLRKQLSKSQTSTLQGIFDQAETLANWLTPDTLAKHNDPETAETMASLLELIEHPLDLRGVGLTNLRKGLFELSYLKNQIHEADDHVLSQNNRDQVMIAQLKRHGLSGQTNPK